MRRPISWLLWLSLIPLEPRAHAQVWSQIGAPYGNWVAVASSADGTKLAAVTTTHIYTSPNSGSDWFVTSAPTKNWSTLASSTNGSVLLAAAPGSGTYGGVYSSTNWGNTWQSNAIPSNATWDTAAVSADGNTLIVGAQIWGYVFYSTNRGTTWSSNGIPSGYWTGVTCSADGTKLAAAWSGLIYVSTNAGVTWTNHTTSGGSHLTCSADGSRLLLWSPSLAVSTNWGATFTSATLPNSSASLILGASADAHRLVALLGGAVYLSTNLGTSWTTCFAPLKSWRSLALTAAGTQMVASTASTSDILYAWRPPVLKTAHSADSLVLSWPTNGTPFGLQRSPDLNPANWVAVTTTPITTNSENQVFLAPTNGAGFFRLISQ